MKNEHLEELSHTVSHIVSHPLQPLSGFRSIKMKIGVLVLGAVATTVVVFWVGLLFGFIWPSVSGLIAAAVALVLTRFFAAGLTTPLREMANVSKRLSHGDYSERVHATSRDEIGALAQTFNAMAEELSRTEILRKELIANASHELKTPLTALQAQLENIVDGIAEPTPARMAALLTQTEHLSALVKQLLDLSRLESGMVELDLAPVKLIDVITSARDVVSSNFPDVKYEIYADNTIIEGDYHRLVQVFTNLMSNAARHCSAPGIVRCSVEKTANSLIIFVDDNGPGIDKDLRAHIFERFFRADTARNSRDGGAGIGLAITKQIIVMHNGSINATTSDLGGCRIEIALATLSHNTNKSEAESGNPANTATLSTLNTKEMTSWHSIPSTM